jgi:hypothetical protein
MKLQKTQIRRGRLAKRLWLRLVCNSYIEVFGYKISHDFLYVGLTIICVENIVLLKLKFHASRCVPASRCYIVHAN